MAKKWGDVLEQVITFVSGYSGSLSMTRTIGRVLSDKELGCPVVIGLSTGDRFDLVAEREVDFGWVIPAKEAEWAMKGIGTHTKALKNLRAIASFPQEDRFMIALSPDAPVNSLEEIAQKKPALQVGVRMNPDSVYGFYENKVFQQYGFSLDDIERWGGRHWSVPTAWNAVEEEFNRGALDLVVGEASTQQIWKFLASRGFRFLGLSKEVVERLEKEQGFKRNIIPAGFLPGIDKPLLSIDESGFLLYTHDETSDELAYTVAKVVDRNKKGIEEGAMRVQYIYREALPIPQMTLTSPLTGPIQRQWESPIPLHPGAERYYREMGYIK